MRLTNLLRVTCTLLLAVLCFSCVMRGQGENATVSGLVTDSSGAIVPKADVQLQSVNRGAILTATTNGAGIYVFASVQPGPYQLTVRKAGFKQVDLLGVIINTQDHIEQNFKLELGSVSESVTVTADQTNINTTDGSVSTTIDRNFAENLPLNGRSFQTLILLTPGTVLTLPPAANGNGGTFSVNGQRANANSFTVDGVSANSGGPFDPGGLSEQNGANPGFTLLGTTQGMVAVDALQEFKIQTSTYSPEFGRQPGGQVSLLTRSGTNDFHGAAFDYLRNNIFDANDWFRDQQGIPKGKEQQNDFGGVLGGPIWRDRTFFFFSYEGLRLLQPGFGIFEVPSSRLRQEASPSYQAILDSFPVPILPESTAACNPATDPGCPSSGQEPTGAALYDLPSSQTSSLDAFSIRVDHALGKRAHVFGRYANTFSEARFEANPNGWFHTLARQRSLTVGADANIGLNLFNELRLNYSVDSSTSANYLQDSGGGNSFDASLLFPPPLTKGSNSYDLIFELPHASFFRIDRPGESIQRQINVVDNISYSIGSHQLRWGIDYKRLFPVYRYEPFDLQMIVQSEGEIIASVLTQAQLRLHTVLHPRYTNFSAYAQDTWRLMNRLTLTYGLRWDLNPTPSDRDGLNKDVLNVVGLNDLATATLASPNAPLYQTTYGNFAPRFGLAYQIRQRQGYETVVRGGVGIFYDLNSETYATGLKSETDALPSSNVPFFVPANTLSIPTFPPARTPPYFSVLGVNPHLDLPYTLQWNASIEQGLGNSQSLTASYVAAAGYRLLRSDFLVNSNPTFQLMQALRNASSSNYQSLQLQFNRRFTRGLQALASYTYSHSIDNSSLAEYVANATPELPNPNLDRGNSDFDLRHAFRAALTYEIPRWKANVLSKAILGGWSLETIGIAQTGLPVDLQGGFTANFFGTVRPDVVPGQPLYLYGQQCATVLQALGELATGAVCPGGMAFNPNAFSFVPTNPDGTATRQGTLRRNVMRGFGAWQTDFALHRQFNLTERVNLQFRGEFFNVFNHPNFSSMDNIVGDGLFGQATTMLSQGLASGLNDLYQIGGPRSIQLALKLTF